MTSLLTPDRLKVIRETAIKNCHLPGVMAELGVYRGGSAKVIAEACPEKTLYLYDTFTGIPSDDEDKRGIHRAGDFATSLRAVQSLLRGCRVRFRVGVFPHTAANVCYSFVHIDGDTYQTTRDAIAFFWPRLVDGGCLIFDDYKFGNCPGVERAIKEAFPDNYIEETASIQCRIRKDASMGCGCQKPRPQSLPTPQPNAKPLTKLERQKLAQQLTLQRALERRVGTNS